MSRIPPHLTPGQADAEWSHYAAMAEGQNIELDTDPALAEQIDRIVRSLKSANQD